MKKKNKKIEPFVYRPALQDINKDIQTIAGFPRKLSKTLKKLSIRDLQKSYRVGGWTALQVIHHLADSHIQAYSRMKMVVTERVSPLIKPYDQDAWAETVDASVLPAKVSVNLLKALHARWAFFLESLNDTEFDKGYFHPEYNIVVPLREAIALYAWHGAHHLAQIKIILHGGGVKIKRKPKKKAQIESSSYPSIEEIGAMQVLKVSKQKAPRAKDTFAPIHPKIVKEGQAKITKKQHVPLAKPQKKATVPKVAKSPVKKTAPVNTAPKKEGKKEVVKLLPRPNAPRPHIRNRAGLANIPKDKIKGSGTSVFD